MPTMVIQAVKRKEETDVSKRHFSPRIKTLLRSLASVILIIEFSVFFKISEEVEVRYRNKRMLALCSCTSKMSKLLSNRLSL